MARKGFDVPSMPKGGIKTEWAKQAEQYKFERFFFEPTDFASVSAKINSIIKSVMPESTEEKVASAISNALNAYQTGLVREERFHLVAEKVKIEKGETESVDISL